MNGPLVITAETLGSEQTLSFFPVCHELIISFSGSVTRPSRARCHQTCWKDDDVGFIYTAFELIRKL